MTEAPEDWCIRISPESNLAHAASTLRSHACVGGDIDSPIDSRFPQLAVILDLSLPPGTAVVVQNGKQVLRITNLETP
jgi:hypothetical protein